MQGIPSYLIWQHLPIKDIINFCRTNIEFEGICRDNHTWRYLLRRDYNIDYKGDNPYEVYKDELKNDLTDLYLSLAEIYEDKANTIENAIIEYNYNFINPLIDLNVNMTLEENIGRHFELYEKKSIKYYQLAELDFNNITITDLIYNIEQAQLELNSIS